MQFVVEVFSHLLRFASTKFDRMKVNTSYYIQFLLVIVCILKIVQCYEVQDEDHSISSPSCVPTSSPSLDTNLAKDFNEIQHMIPAKSIYRLFLHYLFSDEQFQRIVRILVTRDAYTIWQQFRAQPEVVTLTKWTRTQLLLGRDDVSSMEVSSELNDVVKYMQEWSNRKANGWHGFVEEFLMLYPEDLLNTYVHMKVQENGVFAEFWKRLRNVKYAYERVLLMPETQRLCNKLAANGVDVNAVDAFIRRQLDW